MLCVNTLWTTKYELIRYNFFALFFYESHFMVKTWISWTFSVVNKLFLKFKNYSYMTNNLFFNTHTVLYKSQVWAKVNQSFKTNSNIGLFIKYISTPKPMMNRIMLYIIVCKFWYCFTHLVASEHYSRLLLKQPRKLFWEKKHKIPKIFAKNQICWHFFANFA